MPDFKTERIGRIFDEYSRVFPEEFYQRVKRLEKVLVKEARHLASKHYELAKNEAKDIVYLMIDAIMYRR